MNLKQTATLVLRAVIGSVLIYAGLSKAVAPTAEFAGAIVIYRILPTSLIMPLASALPWVEMCVGVYLLFGFWTRLFSMAAAAMFAVYMGVLGSSILRGIDIGSCGCFGAGFIFSPHQTIFIDAGMMVASLLLFRFSLPPQTLAIDTWIEHSTPQKKR